MPTVVQTLPSSATISDAVIANSSYCVSKYRFHLSLSESHNIQLCRVSLVVPADRSVNLFFVVAPRA